VVLGMLLLVLQGLILALSIYNIIYFLRIWRIYGHKESVFLMVVACAELIFASFGMYQLLSGGFISEATQIVGSCIVLLAAWLQAFPMED